MADNPKRILIVEDNEVDVRLLKDILETRGYNILQTKEGLEAIDLSRTLSVWPAVGGGRGDMTSTRSRSPSPVWCIGGGCSPWRDGH
jgi:hypothetical protein